MASVQSTMMLLSDFRKAIGIVCYCMVEQLLPFLSHKLIDPNSVLVLGVVVERFLGG